MHRSRLTIVTSIVAPIVLVAALAGCTSKSAGGATVAVRSTDTDCEVANAELASGATTFDVTNGGSDVTEVYVYSSDDRIVAEVENVGVGSSRSFTVDLSGGDYEIACKPGQKGVGIRVPLSVTGATTTTAAPSRTVELSANEWGYTGLEGFTARVGETVRFQLRNVGTLEHEMEVLGPDGEPVGEVGPTQPGASGDVVVTFGESGEWTMECGIAGHLDHGMLQSFTVTA